MARILMAFWVWVLFCAGVAFAQSYEIQPGDRLEVSVLEDPSLNRTVLVRPDGRISMPLIGSVEVLGQTPEQVQVEIRRRLSRDFVTPPSVTVALSSLGSPGEADQLAGSVAAIYVLGAVGSPGRYDLILPVDILQALAISGGPSPFAATSRIQVRRRSGGSDSVMFFDYTAVEDGIVPLTPIALNDGDVIVVPERGLFE